MTDSKTDAIDLGRVFAVTNPTEQQDVSFFLDRWLVCENIDEQRQLIRSFRNQMINVAAGEMAALRAAPARCDAVTMDEADPHFCAMVNAARDEHIRLKGFAPYTAEIIAMLKAALSLPVAQSSDAISDDPFNRKQVEAICRAVCEVEGLDPDDTTWTGDDPPWTRYANAVAEALSHPDAVTAEPVAYQKRPTFVADAKWTESGNTPDVADEDGQTMREFWREHGYEIRALYASPPSDAVTDQPFVEMLWKWFEDRGVNLRPERSTGLTADDFRVMLDEHEAALSLPAAHSECPHIKPPANLSTPCQICGALGPWFDSGDCKFSSADRATP